MQILAYKLILWEWTLWAWSRRKFNF